MGIAATTRLEFEGNSFPLHTAVRAVGAADMQLRAGLRPDLTGMIALNSSDPDTNSSDPDTFL